MVYERDRKVGPLSGCTLMVLRYGPLARRPLYYTLYPWTSRSLPSYPRGTSTSLAHSGPYQALPSITRNTLTGSKGYGSIPRGVP